MRVLVAFDKFKDALTAREACDVVTVVLRECRPDWTVESCPLTDGGEGFVEVLVSAVGGERRSFNVTGPRGEPVEAEIGWVETRTISKEARALLGLPESRTAPSAADRVAVIEMARASGLALLSPERRDPWQTTSFGTGELIRAAGALGARAILLGVGGSATNDLGLGALAALGLRVLDVSGASLPRPVPACWPLVHRIAERVMPLPLLRIACDVTNPLLGPSGATMTYGPQKGLRADAIATMEEQMTRMADLLDKHGSTRVSARAQPGAGAAGGITFGLVTAAGAQIVRGFELVSTWCGLETRIQRADIVITGEGRFDDTSWTGKGPGAITRRAQVLGKAVHVFAGQVRAQPEPAVAFHAITREAEPLERALRETTMNLASAVRETFGPTTSFGD